MCVYHGERLCLTGIKMATDNCLSVCDGVRNPRKWDFIFKKVKSGLEVRIVIYAVFEFLANDWNRAIPESPATTHSRSM
mgnify:CR=1 FL=1